VVHSDRPKRLSESLEGCPPERLFSLFNATYNVPHLACVEPKRKNKLEIHDVARNTYSCQELSQLACLGMYIHAYVYMRHTHIYIHVCICICDTYTYYVSRGISIYPYICLYKIWRYIYIYIYIYKYINIERYICIYIYIYIYIYIHTHIYIERKIFPRRSSCSSSSRPLLSR
jgi:hypothetical protein